MMKIIIDCMTALGFRVRVTGLVFVFKSASLVLNQVSTCTQTNTFDDSVKCLHWLFLVILDGFSLFQMALGRFGLILERSRSFQVVLGRLRLFQMVLDRFSSFLTLVSKTGPIFTNFKQLGSLPFSNLLRNYHLSY